MRAWSMGLMKLTIKLIAVAWCALTLILSGCARQVSGPVNPSFAVTVDVAREAIDEMQEKPVTLERPLLILSGYLDPGFTSSTLAGYFRRVTEADDLIMTQSFAFHLSFEACRQAAIEEVEKHFPSDDPDLTIEVDVVGFSMGGLVARYAAMPLEGQKRLRIRRLFTIGTPHRGATMAQWPAINPLHREMRHGSEFLEQLNETWPQVEYTLYPYVRLGDPAVGEDNAAPPGQWPWWVVPIPWTLTHNDACRDPRIVADIARRLRNEAPFAKEPAAPLPES